VKELTVKKNDAGRRADRFLSGVFPHLPTSLLAKAVRKKVIKRNNARLDAADRLVEGDKIQIYLPDSLLAPDEKKAYSLNIPELDGIVYEDENIVVVDKQPGLVVHEDESGSPDTLIARIQAYVAAKGEWSPEAENSFAPALCNRIDRNTGGLVIAAKTAEALRDMNEIIKTRQVKKYYLCALRGLMDPRDGTLRSFLRRNEKTKTVESFDAPRPGAKTAVTEYRTLAVKDGLSLVECELVTGRTHQIRAQLAAAGCPLRGDAKYGRADGIKTGQQLYAYKLDFSELQDGGSLSYLKNKSFETKRPDFAKNFENTP